MCEVTGKIGANHVVIAQAYDNKFEWALGESVFSFLAVDSAPFFPFTSPSAVPLSHPSRAPISAATRSSISVWCACYCCNFDVVVIGCCDQFVCLAVAVAALPVIVTASNKRCSLMFSLLCHSIHPRFNFCSSKRTSAPSSSPSPPPSLNACYFIISQDDKIGPSVFLWILYRLRLEHTRRRERV